jgi:ubiquinone biosynthesis monooxygenase Coq7
MVDRSSRLSDLFTVGYLEHMPDRNFTLLDNVISQFDEALRTVFTSPRAARPTPAKQHSDNVTNQADRALAGRLMRVNHTGEVCAQALYQGQALTAKLPAVRDKMEQASQEENDHLAWTRQRVRELGTHTSYLNPFWYAGSFVMGAVAGTIGDRWSLGFLAETERQVVEHLSGHLSRLPAEDHKSRAIVETMREDERHHATVAIEAGAVELPGPVKRLMRLAAVAMTSTTRWI